jgi:L-ascorbate metabolism protein UlaG (beta-lactamase superfamily)
MQALVWSGVRKARARVALAGLVFGCCSWAQVQAHNPTRVPFNATTQSTILATTLAQTTTPAPDRCLAMAFAPPRLPPPQFAKSRSIVQRAKFEPVQLGDKLSPAEVRISFLGHSTFLIETAQGVRIATDYNDYFRPGVVPEIATMNRAHDTHYSNFPDPGIKHLLRGWVSDGGAAQHDVTLGDVRVRNIPTNTRDWAGGTNVYGNSVFVFEVAGLCIAHLGHLHHTLTVQQLGALGQMDIVLVPVDGSYTLDLDGMIEVLKAIKAPLMIPMHYFSSYTLERFLTRVRDSFEIEQAGLSTTVVSRATLPKSQKVLVLPGR